MYIDFVTIKKSGKSGIRHLLCPPFCESGKVKHKTIVNLSNRPEDEIRTIELFFKHKKILSASCFIIENMKTELEKRIGAARVLHVIAERIKPNLTRRLRKGHGGI